MINTTINMHVDGKLYALNKFIKAVSPVASMPSAIDEIAKPVGNGFKTGDIFRKVRRTQVDSTASTTVGGVGGFKGASAQSLLSIFVDKESREDNVVYNEADLVKLKEGKGQSILALEVADFIITGRELDLKQMLANAKVKAASAKLHTAFDGKGLPTGTQPADGNGKLESGIDAIKGGRRVVSFEFDTTTGNVDEHIDGRVQILRAAVSYLNTIGSPKNPTEKNYLFSINGHGLTSIKILTTYADNIAIKEKDTTRFVSVSNNTEANITGIVGYMDNGIKIVQTNQLDAKTRYIVATDRVMVRDLDPTQQYIGKVRDAAAVKMYDGEVYNLKPNERLLQFLQARTWGIKYPEEIFFIQDK